MARIFAFMILLVFCSSAAPAFAQLGAHKTIYSSADAKSRFKKRAVEQENDPSNANYKQRTEFAGYKVSLGEDSTTNLKVINSKNAKACALNAFNPSPSDIDFCKAALDEPKLSDANRFSAQHNMGLMQIEFGEVDAAVQTLLSAAAMSPENPASYLALAKLEFNRGNEAAAMKYAKTALSKNPKRAAQVHLMIGYLYERDFDFDQARTSYEAALANDNGYGDARRRLERLDRLWPAN